MSKEQSIVARRERFVTEARAARKQMQDTGKGYDADEVHAYIRARIAGNHVIKPRLKSWRA